MATWLIGVALLCGAVFGSGKCPYAGIDEGSSMLVADEYCLTSSECYVDQTCKQTKNSTYVGVGSMVNYKGTKLTIKSTAFSYTGLSGAFFLPENVKVLELNSLTKLILPNNINVSAWEHVETLIIKDCPQTGAFTGARSVDWPPHLRDLQSLRGNNFLMLPRNLPSTLQNLTITNDEFNDLSNLNGANLTKLHLDNTRLQEIINLDLRKVTRLVLSNNWDFSVFSGVQLSPALQYLNFVDSQLKNITIDNATYHALNALVPCDQNISNTRGVAMNMNVSTSPSECSTIGGEIRYLFQSQQQFSIAACVLPDKSKQNTSIPSIPTTGNDTPSSRSNTTVIVGIVVGVCIIVVAAIALFIYSKRNRKAAEEYVGSDLDLSEIRPHRLELSDLAVTSSKPLASGGFGEVWSGTYGSQRVAIKRLKSRDPKQVQMFINEITLWAKLDSEYIVKFIGASWTKPIEIECVVEYMDSGDLRSYLSKYSPEEFPWDQKSNCIYSIIYGLIYLHTYTTPIIHRDLKSRNVLLDSVKGTKLTDFGISKEVEDDEATLTSGIGTYQWMAPEVIASTKYTPAADIYSFGIVLSEFCTHQVPYSTMGVNGTPLPYLQILQRVGAGTLFPSFGDAPPSWVKNLADRCLQVKPEDRPTALEISNILRQQCPFRMV